MRLRALRRRSRRLPILPPAAHSRLPHSWPCFRPSPLEVAGRARSLRAAAGISRKMPSGRQGRPAFRISPLLLLWALLTPVEGCLLLQIRVEVHELPLSEDLETPCHGCKHVFRLLSMQAEHIGIGTCEQLHLSPPLAVHELPLQDLAQGKHVVTAASPLAREGDGSNMIKPTESITSLPELGCRLL